jgi:hypothetical protein
LVIGIAGARRCTHSTNCRLWIKRQIWGRGGGERSVPDLEGGTGGVRRGVSVPDLRRG